MNLRLVPVKLRGEIASIPSKSMAHRLLICAALADRPTRIRCPVSSQDIETTAQCLEAIGASAERSDIGYTVRPRKAKGSSILLCRESGSTLRFLLPVAGALGLRCGFRMEGRLPYRPIGPLEREMAAHGILFHRPEHGLLNICGALQPGQYSLPGNVSSQYVSGLLLALPLLDGESMLRITCKLESAAYVDMTLAALRVFNVEIQQRDHCFLIHPASYRSPEDAVVEGDWSNSAFWHAANALGSTVDVTGLDYNSLQADRSICSLLPRLGNGCTIDVADFPDLVPVLAVAATAASGITQFVNAGRLRLKESDRIEAVRQMILALGGQARAGLDSLTVEPTPLSGGIVDTAGDHRIVMSAAIAATISESPVTILGAECVCKSYPNFWKDYAALGGIFEEV